MYSKLTFIEKLFQSNSFPVNIGSRGVVSLRVVDHEPEISLEDDPVFVDAVVELRTHRTQVHRILYDLKVTGWVLVNVSP